MRREYSVDHCSSRDSPPAVGQNCTEMSYQCSFQSTHTQVSDILLSDFPDTTSDIPFPTFSFSRSIQSLRLHRAASSFLFYGFLQFSTSDGTQPNRHFRHPEKRGFSAFYLYTIQRTLPFFPRLTVLFPYFETRRHVLNAKPRREVHSYRWNGALSIQLSNGLLVVHKIRGNHFSRVPSPNRDAAFERDAGRDLATEPMDKRIWGFCLSCRRTISHTQFMCRQSIISPTQYRMG